MAKDKVVRVKTKYPGIYENQNTKKYDVKYNYKVYNPETKKNDYKSKWVYGIATLQAARSELSRLQNEGVKDKDTDITLEGIYEVWKREGVADNYSPNTFKNTAEHMKVIYGYLDKDTKMKNISPEIYRELATYCRDKDYSEETIHSINATIRKMINLAVRNRYITENPLNYTKNIRTEAKSVRDYKLVSRKDFNNMDAYFHNGNFVRFGENHYPKYRLLLNILYYTGMRIGEVLALRYSDFEAFNYDINSSKEHKVHIPSTQNANREHLSGMRVHVTQTYVHLQDFKDSKSPKNKKERTIPLYSDVERLFLQIKGDYELVGGDLTDRIFPWTRGAVAAALNKCCDELKIPRYHPHEFRHTFISNLISNNVPITVIEKVSGDTQETIFKRYSHMLEQDEVQVLLALNNIK